MRHKFNAISAALLALFLTPLATAATCNFSTNATTKVDALLNDCETSATITVDDGYTLDGKGHTITASLDSTGSFSGSAVITNAFGASTILVKNVIVDFGNVSCAVAEGIAFDSVAGIADRQQRFARWSIVHLCGYRSACERCESSNPHGHDLHHQSAAG